MKSSHRHELKTNELAEWLSNLPQWAKENLRMIIYVSVVAVVVIGVASLKWYGKNIESVKRQLELTNLINQLPQRKIQILQTQAKGFDSSYNLLRIAENLQTAAQNAKNDRMAALALIKRAETLRMELHYRLGTVSRRDLTNQINLAKADYVKAIEKSSFNPSLMAKAKFGLGLCEEELGNFAKAQQVYRDIAANASLEGTTTAAAAKHRLDTMADYQGKKVIFKALPKPTQTDLMQPQIKLEAPDTKLTPQTPNNVPGNGSLLRDTANQVPNSPPSQ